MQRGKDPQLSRGPPTARIAVATPLYSTDSAYSLSINKKRNGGERKEREKEVFIEEALHLK